MGPFLIPGKANFGQIVLIGSVLALGNWIFIVEHTANFGHGGRGFSLMAAVCPPLYPTKVPLYPTKVPLYPTKVPLYPTKVPMRFSRDRPAATWRPSKMISLWNKYYF